MDPGRPLGELARGSAGPATLTPSPSRPTHIGDGAERDQPHGRFVPRPPRCPLLDSEGAIRA